MRAEIVDAERTVLVEAALRSVGRNRVLMNKQPVTRRRDYANHLRVTVFSPDDLAMVKGGPARRRDYLDELLEASGTKYASVRADYERVLRQRNALLRGGVRDAEARTTLDVLDDRLVASGGELVRGRLRLIDRLTPGIAEAYESLAGVTPGMAMRYEAEWSEGALEPSRVDDVDGLLRGALETLRRRETDRGITLVGPHRDDWRLMLNDLDARSHASQGEQRTLALALRLAGHRLDRGDRRERPGAAPRRRLQRARPRALGRAGAAPPGDPDPAHHRGRHPAGHRRGTPSDRPRGPRGRRSGVVTQPEEPARVVDALDAIRRELGMGAPSEIDALLASWDGLVGAALAAHSRPADRSRRRPGGGRGRCRVGRPAAVSRPGARRTDRRGGPRGHRARGPRVGVARTRFAGLKTRPVRPMDVPGFW